MTNWKLTLLTPYITEPGLGEECNSSLSDCLDTNATCNNMDTLATCKCNEGYYDNNGNTAGGQCALS